MAAEYYAKGAEEGEESSAKQLAWLSRHPDVFVHRNAAEFRHDTAGAAPAGMARAYGAFREGNFERALPIFLWHAKNGNAEAPAAAALFFKDGLGVPKDAFKIGGESLNFAVAVDEALDVLEIGRAHV